MLVPQDVMGHEDHQVATIGQRDQSQHEHRAVGEVEDRRAEALDQAKELRLDIGLGEVPAIDDDVLDAKSCRREEPLNRLAILVAVHGT